jgi:hypothetical protein
MPNWCENFIRIKVPHQNKEQLLAALQGPEQFWWGTKYWNTIPKNKIDFSAHEKMDTLKHKHQAQKAFETLPGFPDWYEVDTTDISYWITDPKLESHPLNGTVPISFPGKYPWKNKKHYDDWNGEIINHARRVMGIKWTPTFQTQWTEVYIDVNGYTYLDISAETPWGAPENPIICFKNDLVKANAEMTWIYQTEGEMLVGGWWTEGQEIQCLIGQEFIKEIKDEFDDEAYYCVDFEKAEEGLCEFGMPTDMIYRLLQ